MALLAEGRAHRSVELNREPTYIYLILDSSFGRKVVFLKGAGAIGSEKKLFPPDPSHTLYKN